MTTTLATIPFTIAAASAGAQAPVHERLEGLRKTAEELERNSGIDQMIPVLFVIAIAVVGFAILYVAVDGLRKWLRTHRLVKRCGLDEGEVQWLRGLATRAGVKPWTRLLRSTSAFEEITARYLTKTLSVNEEWPEEVLRLRDLAHRIGFTKVAVPSDVTSTAEIGPPWPVEVQSASSETSLHGVVCAGTLDDFTVRTVDPLGVLRDLVADDSVEIHVHDVAGGAAPKFECRVVQARSKGTYRTLRLAHAGTPGPDDGQDVGDATGDGAPPSDGDSRTSAPHSETDRDGGSSS